ncbi:MAG: GNAT family N-acetyltransferase [Prevotella sp.]|nr:GNAT family N-acetyltransferase [Prevotella sp.]
MREIVISTSKETKVSAEELNLLRREAFGQWIEAGIDNAAKRGTAEGLANYIKDKTVFLAHDAATGELLAMRTLTLYPNKGKAGESNLSVSPKAKRQGIATRLFAAETEWLLKAGYRYVTCTTGIPATWSVRWHLKNGYLIVGYSRSERNNYASYVFRKQIATDVWHHPTDLLWTRPIAPVTAKMRYAVSYIATCICKTREGRLNRIGRLAKKIMRR